jgi:hypothetical protein
MYRRRTSSPKKTWDMIPREIALTIFKSTVSESWRHNSQMRGLLDQYKNFMLVEKKWFSLVQVLLDAVVSVDGKLSLIRKHAILFNRYADRISSLHGYASSIDPQPLNTIVTKCVNLKELRLRYETTIKERTLAQLTSLTSLYIHDSLHKVTIQALGGMESLTSLSLGHVNTKARDLLLLSNLTSLKLTGPNAIIINELSFLPKLKSLSLVHRHSFPHERPPIDLTQLTHLSLTQMGNDEHESRFEQLTNLESIEMNGCSLRFTEEMFPLLRNLEYQL